jgi:hypothetical protein
MQRPSYDQERYEHDGIKDYGQAEDHHLVDVKDHGKSRRITKPTSCTVTREQEDGDQQADGGAASAHEHEAVEELLGNDLGGNASRGNGCLVRGKLRSEVRLHNALERVAAVYAEEPKNGRCEHKWP